MSRHARKLAALALLVFAGEARAQSTVVFETHFDTGLPAQFTAPGATIEPVQGYAGLGPAGHAFGGSFLRYALQAITDTKLVLRNLPPHDHVDVAFLFAAIDSWDGTELFKVTVDGTERFSHWFQLATGDASSYVAPPGALLSSGHNLGWNNGTYFFRDRAYDLSVDPAFRSIPHTADTLEVKWFLGAVSGGAAAQWQGGLDESWGLDHVKVTTSRGLVGVEPGPVAPGLTLAGAAPNPAPAGQCLQVRFALPATGPATLELFDVRGRLLAAREVGDLGPGPQTVELAPGPVAPGVVYLRLTQAGVTRTKRVVLL